MPKAIPPPGSIIPVTINGEQFMSVIDHQGIQRFSRVRQIDELVNASVIDLNQLAIATKKARPQVSEDTRRWLYRAMGYSLTGYAEIFPRDIIANPLWNEERRTA